jgi:hypothetical protein
MTKRIKVNLNGEGVFKTEVKLKTNDAFLMQTNKMKPAKVIVNLSLVYKKSVKRFRKKERINDENVDEFYIRSIDVRCTEWPWRCFKQKSIGSMDSKLFY